MEAVEVMDAPQATHPHDADGISVHAGFPNPAADRRLRRLDLNQLLITQPASTFLFRIRGEEGNSQGIFDGDIAIIDRAATHQPQDILLWHDGEHFKLSRQARMQADSAVWGVLVAVIHQYR